jgi:hypothetical protein
VIGSIAAPTLVLDPNGQGETRWEDCVPGRRDYPRHVDDIPVLGLTPFETNDSTSARGWRFDRTPRPGQGRLTGRPTIGLLLVLISPRHEEGAQALRDWADFVHIRHIAEVAVPGYTMITPYEHASGGDPRFMHFYEMDTDEPEHAFMSMTPLVCERIGKPGTDAFRHWAGHPQLRIMYVNSFLRVGASDS